MPTYILPQVRIFQDVLANVDVEAQRAISFIFGGHAHVLRYSQADEKIKILLGSYDHVGINIGGEWKTCYPWPNKPSGSVIDESYTKLFIDKALLRYYQDTSHTMTKTDKNKIRHPSKNFATNGAFPHHVDFLDRGAMVGDQVYVKATVAAVVYELFTYIREFEGEVIASTVGTAASNPSNQPTAGATSNQTADPDNSGDIIVASINHTLYSGYIEGNVEETYVAEVIQASTGGDLTTARLRITSASGNDDVASQVPAALTYPTAIGTRGFTATFGTGTGTDLQVGDTWTFFVREAWTLTVPTAGGTYTGPNNLKYLVEVTTGGISDVVEADDPYITVTSVDGTDFSGPTQVPTAAATAVPIGSYGATMSFSTAKLRKGDRFEVEVTAEAEGAYKTIVLGHALDDAVTEDSAAIDMEIALYIKKDIQVGEKHITLLGDFNWDQSDTEFCAMADIQAYDSSWTLAGVPQPLPVIKDPVAIGYNQLYVEYRAWSSIISTSVGTIFDVADLDLAISGPLTPDNPLKFAVFKALSNNNGQAVRYMAVTDPDDLAAWTAVLNAIEDREDVYGLVPLTYDEVVLDLIQAHCQSQSGPESKRYRVLWANLTEVLTKAVVNMALSSNELIVLATTEDDPSTSGTQFTLLRITSGNADLVELGVRPGDIIRYKFQQDAWGDESYQEYEVDAVLGSDQIRLVTGTTVAENVPIKVEIWRNLDKNEQAAEIGLQAGNYADRRVRAVWPSEIGEAGTLFPGYHLCAALAALAGGVAQNQGLTNVEIKGFDDLSNSLKFNRSQLDVMAVNGTWIVTQDRQSGEVYSRHALTTADYENITEREEMITRNWDLICFRFDDQFSPYIGKCNAVQGMLDIIAAEFEAAKEDLRRPITPQLGPALIDAVITELRISPVFKDRINLSATLTLPFALNNIDFHTLV